jgi:hypothetical protein
MGGMSGGQGGGQMNAYGMGGGMMNGGYGMGGGSGAGGAPMQTGLPAGLSGITDPSYRQGWNPYQQQQTNPWQQQQGNPWQQQNAFLQMLMQPRGGLLPRQQYSEGNVNYASPGGGEMINRPAVANYASPMEEERINPFVNTPVVPAWNPEAGGGA